VAFEEEKEEGDALAAAALAADAALAAAAPTAGAELSFGRGGWCSCTTKDEGMVSRRPVAVMLQMMKNIFIYAKTSNEYRRNTLAEVAAAYNEKNRSEK